MSIWSTLELLRKKVWFSFSFFLFDCVITLINMIPLCCWSSDFDTFWRWKRNMVATGPAFLFFPTFQRCSCFPVFSCFLLFVLCFFSSKNFGFSGIFLHRVLTDPGKPGKPWKINQCYQSQGKVSDFFYTEGSVHILFFIFKNE